MELSKFLVAYRINDDYWWTLSLGDAQVLFDAALARAEAAEAEVGRLQAALDQWKQCGDAIMLCATGRAAPLSDSDVCGEIARRRTQVATMEVELAMTSNALRVTQDSVLRNIDRADVAEAEVKRLRAQVATMEAQLQEVRTEYRVACEDFNELLEKASER